MKSIQKKFETRVIGFSFFSLFISLTLFFIVINSDHLKNREKGSIENKVLLVLSSFFLVQSFMSYFLPPIIGFITIFLYSLFSANFKQYLKELLIFYGSFIIFLFIFDLIALNFFSFWSFQFLSSFSEMPFNFVSVRPYSLRIILTALLFYTMLLISLFVLIFIYKFSSNLSTLIIKTKLKIKIIF